MLSGGGPKRRVAKRKWKWKWRCEGSNYSGGAIQSLCCRPISAHCYCCWYCWNNSSSDSDIALKNTKVRTGRWAMTVESSSRVVAVLKWTQTPKSFFTQYVSFSPSFFFFFLHLFACFFGVLLKLKTMCFQAVYPAWRMKEVAQYRALCRMRNTELTALHKPFWWATRHSQRSRWMGISFKNKSAVTWKLQRQRALRLIQRTSSLSFHHRGLHVSACRFACFFVSVWRHLFFPWIYSWHKANCFFNLLFCLARACF